MIAINSEVLEEEVGVRLLERDRNRRVALTDAGQIFLADAKRTLAAAEATLRHTREAANGARGPLNVANMAALSTRVVPPLLQLFRVLHPEVEVFMVELDPLAKSKFVSMNQMASEPIAALAGLLFDL